MAKAVNRKSRRGGGKTKVIRKVGRRSFPTRKRTVNGNSKSMKSQNRKGRRMRNMNRILGGAAVGGGLGYLLGGGKGAAGGALIGGGVGALTS